LIDEVEITQHGCNRVKEVSIFAVRSYGLRLVVVCI
jgi:hypothetical protein